MTRVDTEKILPLGDISIRQFYRKYVELMQPLLKLRDREIDVFAELLYYNYLKRDTKDIVDRMTLVFNIATRRSIQQHLKVSNIVIQQALGSLRKNRGSEDHPFYLIKGIKINEAFIVYPEKEFKMSFKFKITEDEHQ
jgi:hypothetical protein